MAVVAVAAVGKEAIAATGAAAASPTRTARLGSAVGVFEGSCIVPSSSRFEFGKRRGAATERLRPVDIDRDQPIVLGGLESCAQEWVAEELGKTCGRLIHSSGHWVTPRAWVRAGVEVGASPRLDFYVH
ncbi:hypothetical protein CO678_39445 [Bradyrhizobium diazoefficiens]|nr:hypothetical protein CO678_39445 [Bradyrhizobium diazoefficiens]